MFRLAVQRKYKNEQGKYDADFLTVVCWRGTADLVKRHICKGDRVGVVGAIQVRGWQDESGSNRTATEIVADEIEFMSNRRKPDEAAYSQEEQGRPEFVQVDDDELPF